MSGDVEYFITPKIADALSVATQNLLWLMSRACEAKENALQIFRLLSYGDQQQIIYSYPPKHYESKVIIPWPTPITAEIYVVNSENYAIMMFANEYQKEEK